MALKDAPIVEVLKFDEAEAYDHNRPISGLIRTQLLHLHHAEQLVVPAKAQTNVNINKLHTELEASEYIEKITALLHKHGKGQSTQLKKSKGSQSKSKKTASKSKKAVKSTRTRKSHR
jgi:hypothetical protein